MKKKLIFLIINFFAFNCLFGAKVAIVLDDFGYSGYASKKILTLKYNITLAILPFGPIATEFALKAKKAGFETILHLPLEPHKASYIDETYLTVNLDTKEIEERIVKDMLKVPGIVGANNHQGSLFTENFEKMKILLRVLKKYNLFFLDSLTSKNSMVKKAGKDLNIKVLSRDVFLDNSLKESYILHQLKVLFKKAKKRGYAIGIGHARGKTIDTLQKFLPGLLKEYPDIKLVNLNELYN